jgi:hypothetical protein
MNQAGPSKAPKPQTKAKPKQLKSVRHIIKHEWSVFWQNKHKISGCTWFSLVFPWGLILIPFFLEGFLLLLALFTIFPLGFIFLGMKKKIPPLWILISIFITLGGIADVGSDIALLGRVIYNYYGNTEFEEEEEGGMEKSLFLLRVIITLITGLAGVVLILYRSREWVQLQANLKGKTHKLEAAKGLNHPLFLLLAMVRI